VRDVGLLAIRAVNGGVFVVVFALIGEVLKPKRLAGLFGAAPSIALANLLVVIADKGDRYAGRELEAMIFGAVGFVAYCLAERVLLMRWHTIPASVASCGAWAALALGGYFGVLR
jgi:uncharacterized membrane protein (GlpM family)